MSGERWPVIPTISPASSEAVPPANTRKPLPRHIVKQILDAGSAGSRWVDPVQLEMEARRRARREAGEANSPQLIRRRDSEPAISE